MTLLSSFAKFISESSN